MILEQNKVSIDRAWAPWNSAASHNDLFFSTKNSQVSDKTQGWQHSQRTFLTGAMRRMG